MCVFVIVAIDIFAFNYIIIISGFIFCSRSPSDSTTITKPKVHIHSALCCWWSKLSTVWCNKSFVLELYQYHYWSVCTEKVCCWWNYKYTFLFSCSLSFLFLPYHMFLSLLLSFLLFVSFPFFLLFPPFFTFSSIVCGLFARRSEKY